RQHGGKDVIVHGRKRAVGDVGFVAAGRVEYVTFEIGLIEALLAPRIGAAQAETEAAVAGVEIVAVVETPVIDALIEIEAPLADIIGAVEREVVGGFGAQEREFRTAARKIVAEG